MMLPLLLACGADVEPVVVAAASPVLSIDRDVDRTPWSGTVHERVDAGGYTYLRVNEAWVVGLDKPVAVGDTVQVRPIGRADGFESRRTGRTFDTLWFAVLRRERTGGSGAL